MQNTWLLQRLSAPRSVEPSSTVKPHHVFGGANIGLGPEAWTFLDTMCTLEYMGAAEFEWGGLPKTLSHMWDAGQNHKSLTSFAFNLAPHERALSWNRKFRRGKEAFPAARTVTVFGICYTHDLDEVKSRVSSFCKEDVKDRSRCPQFKREPLIHNSFDLDMLPKKEENYPSRPTQGWIDIDNDFMFFSNAKMWTDFCSCFGITPCAVPEIIPSDYTKLSKPDLAKLAVSLGVFQTKTEASKIRKPELLSLLS